MKGIIVLLSATTMFVALTTAPVSAREVMTDRCSAEVALVPSYDARPDTPATIVLKRGSNGSTPWTPPFTVGPEDRVIFVGGAIQPPATCSIQVLGASKN